MNDLRLLMKMKGIPFWKVAKAIGICEMTLHRWLRTYSKERYDIIMKAIIEIDLSSNYDLSLIPTDILQSELERRNVNNEVI